MWKNAVFAAMQSNLVATTDPLYLVQMVSTNVTYVNVSSRSGFRARVDVRKLKSQLEMKTLRKLHPVAASRFEQKKEPYVLYGISYRLTVWRYGSYSEDLSVYCYDETKTATESLE